MNAGYARDSTGPYILWCSKHGESHRLNGYGMLSQPIKELSPRCRFAAIEAEDKLIEIIVEIFMGCTPLKGSQQPSFQEGNNKMNTGELSFTSMLESLNSLEFPRKSGEEERKLV